MKAKNPIWSLGQLSIQNKIEIGTKLIIKKKKKKEQGTKVKWRLTNETNERLTKREMRNGEHLP